MFVANILHNIPREATKGSAGLAGSNGAHGAQPLCLALACGFGDKVGPRVVGVVMVRICSWLEEHQRFSVNPL